MAWRTDAANATTQVTAIIECARAANRRRTARVYGSIFSRFRLSVLVVEVSCSRGPWWSSADAPSSRNPLSGFCSSSFATGVLTDEAVLDIGVHRPRYVCAYVPQVPLQWHIVESCPVCAPSVHPPHFIEKGHILGIIRIGIQGGSKAGCWEGGAWVFAQAMPPRWDWLGTFERTARYYSLCTNQVASARTAGPTL